MLDAAAAIREASEGEFDLTALGRQAELLAQAQAALAGALEDVGRG